MKVIKSYLVILLALTTVIFSACDEPGDFIEPTEPNIISTYAPEISNGQVTFKGSLGNTNGALEHGFMWYISDHNGNSEELIHRVVVGSGNVSGGFEKVMNELPRGVNLIVCAYVDYQDEFSQTVNAIGDEIDFIYD